MQNSRSLKEAFDFTILVFYAQWHILLMSQMNHKLFTLCFTVAYQTEPMLNLAGVDKYCCSSWYSFTVTFWNTLAPIQGTCSVWFAMINETYSDRLQVWMRKVEIWFDFMIDLSTVIHVLWNKILIIAQIALSNFQNKSYALSWYKFCDYIYRSKSGLANNK